MPVYTIADLPSPPLWGQAPLLDESQLNGGSPRCLSSPSSGKGRNSSISWPPLTIQHPTNPCSEKYPLHLPLKISFLVGGLCTQGRDFCRHWDIRQGHWWSREQGQPLCSPGPWALQGCCTWPGDPLWAVIVIFDHLGTGIFSIFPGVLVLKNCQLLGLVVPLTGEIWQDQCQTGGNRFFKEP